MGIFIYKLNNDKTAEIQKSTELQAQINSLNGTVGDLQRKINSISNIINNSDNTVSNNPQNKTASSYVTYIVLELEDIEAEEKNQQGLKYKNKIITDKKKIDVLMKIIDSATPYKEQSFIADFGDVPPSAKIYLSNGENYTVAAGDEYDDAGNFVNLMTKWYSSLI